MSSFRPQDPTEIHTIGRWALCYWSDEARQENGWILRLYTSSKRIEPPIVTIVLHPGDLSALHKLSGNPEDRG